MSTDNNQKRKKRKILSGKYLLPLLAVIIVVTLVLLLFSHSDSRKNAAEISESSVEKNAGGRKSSSGASTEKPEKPSYLNMSYKEKIKYMKKHKNRYPKRYRKMAKEYPETVDFVLQYPKLHKKNYKIDLTEEAKADQVPSLIQWDKRWGYRDYGDGDMGYTGCGPTCISMVALYLTDNASYSPIRVAGYADKHHYYVNGEGTKWDFISNGCKAFHIKAREITISKKAVSSALKKHHPVICSVSEGDFTDHGHFIVLTSYHKGKFTVNDPNSRINSKKKWTWKRLKGQIRCCWSYSKLKHSTH